MSSLFSNIHEELQAAFQDAEEIWIAVAMMTSAGLTLIKNVPRSVRQHVIVGIDLPTPPAVLRRLKKRTSSNFNAKVCLADYTFHPKCYIVRQKNGQYLAYVGSSNATKWGLQKNEELNIKIENQDQCLELLNWFEDLGQRSIFITDKFIQRYETAYKKVKQKTRKIQADVSSLKQYDHEFLGQFFSENHHEIFADEYVELENDEIKSLRKEVRGKLLELHGRIYPKFREHGLVDLHCHHSKKDIVSKHFFTPYSGYYIESLWLHYGKSKSQLNQYGERESFLNHARLQVIIHHQDVGVWLMLGIENKGHADRDHFRRQMANKNTRHRFYQEMKKLDDDYWIDFKGWEDRVYVKDIQSVEALKRLMDQESIKHYFILGKSYDPHDQDISDSNITHTVLNEFKKLYPLYEIMREYPGS